MSKFIILPSDFTEGLQEVLYPLGWGDIFYPTVAHLTKSTTRIKTFLVWNREREHHYWILHIRISLGTKFQLKLRTLIFGTKFAQKGYFRLKKWSSPLNFAYSDYSKYQFQLKLNFWIFAPDLPNLLLCIYLAYIKPSNVR